VASTTGLLISKLYTTIAAVDKLSCEIPGRENTVRGSVIILPPEFGSK